MRDGRVFAGALGGGVRGAGQDEPRLGWWRSDLTSEFGGRDLFERLLPRTFRWASFQAVREAARRADAEQRERAHNPDGVTSLYSLGRSRGANCWRSTCAAR